MKRSPLMHCMRCNRTRLTAGSMKRCAWCRRPWCRKCEVVGDDGLCSSECRMAREVVGDPPVPCPYCARMPANGHDTYCPNGDHIPWILRRDAADSKVKRVLCKARVRPSVAARQARAGR